MEGRPSFVKSENTDSYYRLDLCLGDFLCPVALGYVYYK